MVEIAGDSYQKEHNAGKCKVDYWFRQVSAEILRVDHARNGYNVAKGKKTWLCQASWPRYIYGRIIPEKK